MAIYRPGRKTVPIVLLYLALLSWSLLTATPAYEVVYAVNCGGPKHTDSFGIKYSKDSNHVGIASDFGKSMIISRVHPDDQILYQTERYHHDSFTYEIPIKSDGDYVLVLKFAEVYFQWANGKVFDVVLNSQHTVVDHLDIFAKVGRAVAHDEIIPFKVEDGQLMLNNEVSSFDGTLVVEFVKGPQDNPKINAILVARGKPEDLPPMPPLNQDQDQAPNKPEVNTEWGDTSEQSAKFKHKSGPRVVNPYNSDESWFMPIMISIAVFLPVLFCLCRVR